MLAKNLQAAVAGQAAGGAATYVEDVFSTYLYTGNGSAQTISNGIALASGNLIDTSTFDGIRITYDHNHSDPVRAIIEKSDNNSSWTTVLNSSDLQWANGEQGDKSASWTTTSAKYWRIRFTDPADGNIGGQGDSLQEVEWRQNGSYITGAYSEYTITSSGLGGTLANITDGSGSTGMDSISEGATVVFSKNGAAVEGQGGMVWIKSRESSGGYPVLFDTERGAKKRLISSLTNGEYSYSSTSLTSFNADGFSLVDDSAGSDNVNGAPGGTYSGTNAKYASWTFRKAPKFFDVVTWTADGTSPRNISHNLGSVPGTIIVKRLDSAASWFVYHRSSGATKYLFLNSTDAEDTNSGAWNNTAPTASVFTVGSFFATNGTTWVAYLFAHDAGGFGDSGDQSVIKCGTYTTDGSGNATIDLGWEPQWLLLKSTDSGRGWIMLDNMRGITTGGNDAFLYANTADAEASGNFWEVNATGFKQLGLWSNENHIYIAIRRGPMKTPEDATKVFATWIAPDSGATITTNVGFPVDLVISTWRNGALSGNKYTIPRLTTQYMFTNNTNAESGATYYFDNMTGVGGVGSVSNVYPVQWNFRRAPGFFDVVCYKGTSVSGTVINHNLGVAPEFLITKVRNYTGEDWIAHYNDGSSIIGGLLNSTSAFANSSTAPSTDITSLTSTSYTLNTSNRRVNGAYNYVAYLFASVPGVSKVGSFTNSGSAINIDCGFSNGARFVLIKGSSVSSNWAVMDTTRGIVSANDPTLLLNSTSAELTSYDLVDPYAAGFTVVGSSLDSGTYIYLAIA